MFTSYVVRAAILLAAAGILSRLTFRHFETRWQILIFWAVAAGYQLVLRPVMGRRVSAASLALDIGCVTLAIVATKVAIEGRL